MIDKIGLDAKVPGQHVRDEPFRERWLVAQESKHRGLVDDEYRRQRCRGGRSDPNRLTC